MRLASVHRRDLIAGLVLFAVALVWIVLVYQTIEPSQGTEAGPRAFPLFFGVALAVLSLLLMLQSVRPSAADDVEPVHAAAPGELTAVAATVGGLAIFAFLLEPIGFIPSTALVVSGFMFFLLRVRSPVLIASMAVGLSLGSYLVFGKLLGTYLPPGTWITIYF